MRSRKAILFFHLSCLMSIIFFNCNNKQPGNLDESQHLFALEREAITREFQNDTAFLSTIMDSTFMELSKSKIKNKHEVLKTIFQDNMVNQQDQRIRDSFHLQDSVIHLSGNTAIITFIMQTYNRKGDSSFIRRTRFYDVWVKRNEGWKAVTWQASPAE